MIVDLSKFPDGIDDVIDEPFIGPQLPQTTPFKWGSLLQPKPGS